MHGPPPSYHFQIDIAQHYLITELVWILGHQAFHFTEGVLTVFLLQIDTELLHTDLFALAQLFFEPVQKCQYPIVLLLAIIDVQQIVYRIQLVGEAYRHILQQTDSLIRFFLLLI